MRPRRKQGNTRVEPEEAREKEGNEQEEEEGHIHIASNGRYKRQSPKKKSAAQTNDSLIDPGLQNTGLRIFKRV